MKGLLANLIDIQESIAHKIANELAGEYGIILQRLTTKSQRIRPGHLDAYHAILKFYYYESESAKDAFNALEEAIARDPGSGMATAMLAIIYGNQYMLDLPNAKQAYLKTRLLAERASELDPHHLIVRIVFAYKCFVYNQKELLFKETDRCLSMRPNSPLAWCGRISPLTLWSHCALSLPQKGI